MTGEGGSTSPEYPKAYIKQVGRGFQYKRLHPVYSLNIINENFDNNPDTYIYHYQIIHTQDTNKVMEGLEFVFIELPKFKAKKFTDKKLKVLWLRFLSEINDLQEWISPDFLDVPEIKEATDLILESGLTKGELETYDRYWDIISTEKTFLIDAYDKGIEQGIEQERKFSDNKIKAEKLGIARNLKKTGVSSSDILLATGFTEQEIESGQMISE